MITSIHAIAWDPSYKYWLLKEQYPNIDYYSFNLLYLECYKKNADINEMAAIAQKETDWTNTHRNGHDWSTYQINEHQIWQRGMQCYEYMDLRISTPVAVDIWLSAKKKAKGDLRMALFYYNAGENANPKTYNGWKSYVDVIIKDYEKSRERDREIIFIN
jgi:hypothetical protein